ncbi:MAG TPA: ABC transporter permease [Terriglobia bacterium]|nr:ABC transporter permease [Terriglobia bacterium]
MSMFSSIRTFLDFLFRRKRVEREMEDELRSHLQIRADDLERRGLSRAEAERQARIEFGGYQRYKEECREALGTRLAAELVADLRYGLRQLRRNPGFTAVAVLTLALGIGANTAIFGLLDAVMLRSLPVRNPSQLVVFRWKARRGPGYHGYSGFGDCTVSNAGPNPSGCSFSYPFFTEIRSKARAFSGVTAFAGPAQLDVSGNGAPSIARGEIVSGDYFSTLGIGAAVGRTIGPGDDSPRASPVIVLDYAYWQSAFGGERSALGRTLILNNVPFTIVGVADRRFTNLSPGKAQDFWLPIAMAPRLGISWAADLRSADNWWLVVLGRLKPGVSRGQAQAATGLLFRDEMLHGAKPLSKPQDDPQIALLPAQRGLTGVRFFYSTSLFVLMAAVGIILLIACANVAGLLLSRAKARYKEMAVRLAVGAGRARILRQLLTESVMLSCIAGALGVAFAYWGLYAIEALMSTPEGDAFPFVVSPDGRILGFTVAISLLTGILFGLAPAFRGTRLDLTPALKESASTAPDRSRARRGFRLGSALVVIQVGLSVVVLVGAGLLVRTLENLRAINPGFDTRNVLLFGINPALAGYTDAQIQNLYRNLQEGLAALPGVVSVSYSSDALLSGSLWSTTVHVHGQSEKQAPTDALAIGPGFFRTLGIPLVDGRRFTPEDFRQAAKADALEKAAEKEANAAPPASGRAPAARPAPLIPILVNRAFVRKYVANHNPLGKLLSLGMSETASKPSPYKWQIVGIVGDAKYSELKEAVQPTMYVPATSGGAHFEVRTAGNPTALIPAVRNAANRVNSRLPLFDIHTQSQKIDDLLVNQRFMARLGSFFGALAVLLACVGLYGLLSYEVTRRTREIGIRMALGAQRGDVLRNVAGQGLILALMGIGCGVAAALALTRLVGNLLYGVKPTDPLTFAAVSLILLGVALLACYIPARRAAKVDPMIALRYE